MTRVDSEPLSIDAAYVARWLDDRGRHQSAALVRDLGRQCREFELRRRIEAERYAELLARLQMYEPPELAAAPNFQPPPEASD